MYNRSTKGRGSFLDKTISARKNANTFLDKVYEVVNWRPIERPPRKKLRRNKDAISNPADTPLSMFKVLLLRCGCNLSDQGTDDALTNRISFVRFADFDSSHAPPDSTTICRFRGHLAGHGLDVKLFGHPWKHVA